MKALYRCGKGSTDYVGTVIKEHDFVAAQQLAALFTRHTQRHASCVVPDNVACGPDRVGSGRGTRLAHGEIMGGGILVAGRFVVPGTGQRGRRGAAGS